MAQTQFKTGNRPENWLPIGSLRTTPDGYQQKKITDTGYPPVDWKAVHVLLWEEHHGPVAINLCVCFKDGNKSHMVKALGAGNGTGFLQIEQEPPK
jgi:hypothetical protein